MAARTNWIPVWQCDGKLNAYLYKNDQHYVSFYDLLKELTIDENWILTRNF